jgi:hypothetical protein
MERVGVDIWVGMRAMWRRKSKELSGEWSERNHIVSRIEADTDAKSRGRAVTTHLFAEVVASPRRLVVLGEGRDCLGRREGLER